MSVVMTLRNSLSWDTTMSVFFHLCRYSCRACQQRHHEKFSTATAFRDIIGLAAVILPQCTQVRSGIEESARRIL